MTEDPDDTILNDPDDDATRLIVRKNQQALQPGDVVRDRFIVESMLGEGGMGQVFLAVDQQAEKSNPYVALKLLGNDFKEHPQAFAALRREAMQSRRLTHPNIVAVYDFDRTEDHVYMVMEYLKGSGLENFVRANPDGNPLETVWPIIAGCGAGLEYVHQQNIVHADFKPSNVFMTEDGDVKVLDLGIARTLDESVASSGTTRFDPDALGALTPQYASCEMFEGLPPKPPDDLYALACVAYELLTGEHPFQRRTALEARSQDLQPERPPGLKSRQWKVLRAGLMHSRAERPDTVQDFLDELTPEKKRASALPWIAASVVIAGVAGVQLFTQYTVSDEELIAGIMEQYPVELAELAGRSELELHTEMSAQMVQMGIGAVTAGDYRRADHVLLSGSSSAFRSYREVLTRSDDNQTRWAAAEGLLELTRQLGLTVEGMAKAGAAVSVRAKVVCGALDIVPGEPALRELLDGLRSESEAGVMEVGGCRDLIDSGRLDT